MITTGVRIGQVLELNRPDLDLGDYVIVVVGLEREDVWQCLVLFEEREPADEGSVQIFRTASLTKNFSEVA